MPGICARSSVNGCPNYQNFGEGACCGGPKYCLTDDAYSKTLKSIKGQHLKALHVIKHAHEFGPL